MRRTVALAAVAVLGSCTVVTADMTWDNFDEFDLGTIGPLDSAPNGGGPMVFTLNVEDNSKAIIGWGIDFIYDEDPTPNLSWASDIQMILTSPTGDSITVGGISTPGFIEWDFQGGGSTDPGFYQDDPQDAAGDPSNNFQWKDNPQPKGAWTVSFFNDWNSSSSATLTMSEVHLRLYKQLPAPGALALLGLAGLAGSRRRRMT